LHLAINASHPAVVCPATPESASNASVLDVQPYSYGEYAVQGLTAGMASVRLVANGVTRALSSSITVAPGEYIALRRLDVLAATSLVMDFVSPTSLHSIAAVALRTVNANLNAEGATAYIAAGAIFSDGTTQLLTAGDGLFLRSHDLTEVEVSGSAVKVAVSAAALSTPTPLPVMRLTGYQPLASAMVCKAIHCSGLFDAIHIELDWQSVNLKSLAHQVTLRRHTAPCT